MIALDQPPGVEREQVLARRLSAGRQAMLAVGGALGTGLFLGSGLSVHIAGPAVIFSYVIGVVIAALLGVALTEMAAAHPTAGSFGLYADMYVSRFAGYAVRVSYWIAEVLATGGHLVAMAIYMQFWFPEVPGTVWTLVFAVLLTYVNTRAVKTFGDLEYWLTMTKVAAVAVFVGLGAAALAGLTSQAAIGLRHYTDHGGFLPFGWLGIWYASCFTIYSFIGVEIASIASGEAGDPARTVPRAMRRNVLTLSAIYLVTVTLLVGLMPWNQAGVGESPFVSVLRLGGIPGAATVMNLVVLVAAFSSANANTYAVSRTLFSLARAGLAPRALGTVSDRATPVNALLVSSLGLLAAVLVRAVSSEAAYVWFLGVALFGGLFVWLMIFVTHLAFRRHWARQPGRALPVRIAYAPAASIAGGLLLAALLVTTWWVPGLRVTLLAGGPWLAVLGVGYWLAKRRATTR